MDLPLQTDRETELERGPVVVENNEQDVKLAISPSAQRK